MSLFSPPRQQEDREHREDDGPDAGGGGVPHADGGAGVGGPAERAQLHPDGHQQLHHLRPAPPAGLQCLFGEGRHHTEVPRPDRARALRSSGELG